MHCMTSFFINYLFFGLAAVYVQHKNVNFKHQILYLKSMTS